MGTKKAAPFPGKSARAASVQPRRTEVETMLTVAHSLSNAQTTVSYARLHDTLEGYAIVTPTGVTYFCDHDAHLYALTPDQAQALTLLGTVPAVERANVLAARAGCEEMR